MSGPQVIVDLDIIEANARAITQKCAESGIEVFGVTKGTCGMPQVARAMLRGGVTGIGESRFENIRRLRDSGLTCKILLLRSPPPSLVDDVVKDVDISLNSEIEIIEALSDAAIRRSKIHDIILMVDLGDLREGVWPDDLEDLVAHVQALPGVRLVGLGTNLLCLSAVMPSDENLGKLADYASRIETKFDLKLQYVSGGNSGSLPLLLEKGLPKGINHLRIGEAILQGGRDTFYDEPWTALNRNAFLLEGELIEVKRKPSRPIGKTSVDAFGNVPTFVDRGERLRGILNIGREDVSPEHLTPLDQRVELLGASSDHLILDLEAMDPLPEVGDKIHFHMGYSALLAAMTSEYVIKTPLRDYDEDNMPDRAIALITEPELAHIGDSIDLPARLAELHIDVTPNVTSIGNNDMIAKVLDAMQNKRTPLMFGADPMIMHDALKAATQLHDSIGLILFDAHAHFEPLHTYSPNSVLYHAFNGEGIDLLTPQLSPENVVIVGLRSTTPDEAIALRESRVNIFTIADIDALGMHEVTRRAILLASSGTAGVWVNYNPCVTDIRGDSGEGAGGITFRETHQTMETIAQSCNLLGLSVTGLSIEDFKQRIHHTLHFILSALGKKIF